MAAIHIDQMVKVSAARSDWQGHHGTHGHHAPVCSPDLQIPHARYVSDDGLMQARTRHVEACVAHVFAVPHEALRASTRGRADVARARQVAMYICHTTLAFSLTAVGELFDRDRTTVGHACRLVEDLRDDADFDMMVACLEKVVLGCLVAGYTQTVLSVKVAHHG